MAVSLNIPARGSRAGLRGPAYVSPNTKSLSVDFGRGPQNFDTTLGAPGCTAQPNVPPALTEFATTYPQPRGATTGADGNVWFIENQHNPGILGRVTPSGTITEFNTTGYAAQWVASGADGRLYVGFICCGAQANLDVFTTSGTYVTTYAAGVEGGAGTTFNSGGYDGAIWTTEYLGTGKIIRTTTAGGTAQFTPPSGPAQNNVVPGPDGAMWFSEASVNKVGRVTSTGVFTEFAVPTANAGLGNVFLGPDGLVWFLEANVNRIGRINPQGYAFNEIQLPTGENAYLGASAPDGAFYYLGGAGLGRVTPDGATTVYPILPMGAGPYAATIGGDGNFWYTDSSRNKVVRVTLPVIGGVSCTFNATAPVGNATVLVKLYDQTGGAAGSGNVLSASSTLATLAANQPNILNLTLGGVVRAFSLRFTPPSLQSGTAATAKLTVSALDANGRIIVGPGTFVDAAGNPLKLTLSSSDASGATTLAPTVFTSPSAAATLTYNGAGSLNVTITPSVSGGTYSGPLTPVTFNIP